VAVQTRSARSPLNGHEPNGGALPDNRLELVDQAFYAAHRAAGQKEVMQVVWIYERAVNIDEVRRFHHRLADGLLGRRIERSPLPFGRYRWVTDPKPPELDIAEYARPRAEFADWLDERSQLPIDPETGPGWRLSVVSFADGSSAATLVISHYVVDGLGAVVAVALAGMGENLDLGYPPARSRSRLRALVRDAGETARDAPAVARAFVAAVKKEARNRKAVVPAQAPRLIPSLSSNAADPVTLPSIWMRIKMDEWAARAEALGGTNSTLATAFTAKLDERMGRRHVEAGDVNVILVVNDRTEGDVRAIAVSFANVGIDPTLVTTDLRAARAAIKHALKLLPEAQDESSELVPLIPFTPKQIWKKSIENLQNDPDQPAVCSNLGDTGPAVIRLDGVPCQSAFARGMRQNLTQGQLDQMSSQLQLYFGTSVEINTVGIHIRAYQPGSVTTKAELRELAQRTLAEFGLTAEID
jgi:hypothetical protein